MKRQSLRWRKLRIAQTIAPGEVIFGQTLQIEVLESTLKGDFCCRFAIHLPEQACFPSQ